MIPADWPGEVRPLEGGWSLSDSHAASSYGQPVLVSPEGTPFGPGDLLGATEVAEMRGIDPQTLRSYLTRRQFMSAGQGWRRVGRSSGWAVFAADAVRA